MKTIKIIDLLNKIAKGEITELHKFKWNEGIWEEYSKFEEINNEKSYQEHRKNGTSFMRFENICDARHFNDEIEIIEEEKKIDNISITMDYAEEKANSENIQNVFILVHILEDKINELIDVVNELKEK